MNSEHLEAIIIGAGQAGLGASYCLTQYGIPHVVFERGQIGESWCSQRWDSFLLNSASKINALPGMPYEGPDPDRFDTCEEYVSMLRRYVTRFRLPVREHTPVVAVDRTRDNTGFTVTVNEDQSLKQYSCRQVIVASGAQNERKIPPFAGSLDPEIVQLHTIDYRSAASLPEGGVLVAGSGQSGCQIAEDLLDAGRNVYLSTSQVARVPRYYRGSDIMDWLINMKFFDARPEEITDPAMLHMRPPQLTGVGRTRTISLQSMARRGAVILGKTENAEGSTIYLQPNAATHVKFADGFSQKVKSMIDEFIIRNNLDGPPAEPDAEDVPDFDAACASPLTSLDLAAHNIHTVIWATGFNCRLDYIRFPVRDDAGSLIHRDGVSPVPGLYFMGFPWLRTRKSFLIHGVQEDAPYIAEQVNRFAGATAMDTVQ